MTRRFADDVARARSLLASWIALLLVAGLGAAAANGAADVTLLGRAPAETTTVPPTTTTTAPPRLPPIGDTPVVLRSPSGLLLPLLGGAPGAYEVRTPCFGTAVTDGEAVFGAHVVLDPGHGGSEPGAVGPRGLTERDVNLDVALRTAHILRTENPGIVVELTRQTDIRVPIVTRAELAVALDPMILVSIHHNGTTSPGGGAAPGVEVYHQQSDADSRRFAGLLHEEYLEHFAPFQADWTVSDRPGVVARISEEDEDFYGILRRTNGVPSVLSEALYLTNDTEEALLLTEEFRQAEARAIADAFRRFVDTEDPGSGFIPAFRSSASPGGSGGTNGCVDPPL